MAAARNPFSSRVTFAPLVFCIMSDPKAQAKQEHLGSVPHLYSAGLQVCFHMAEDRACQFSQLKHQALPPQSTHKSLDAESLWCFPNQAVGYWQGGAGCKNVAFLDLLSCSLNCLVHLCQVGWLVLLALQCCQEPLALLGIPVGHLLQTCPASTLHAAFPSPWLWV